MMEILKGLTHDTKEIKEQQRNHSERMRLVTEEMKELKNVQKEFRRVNQARKIVEEFC